MIFKLTESKSISCYHGFFRCLCSSFDRFRICWCLDTKRYTDFTEECAVPSFKSQKISWTPFLPPPKSFQLLFRFIFNDLELLGPCVHSILSDLMALSSFVPRRVAEKEPVNKMSLHNLATVFGPTLLRPSESESTKGQHITSASDIWSHDVMAQVPLIF